MSQNHHQEVRKPKDQSNNIVAITASHNAWL